MEYEYTFIHRPAKMMKDVDALSRRFGKCVAAYLIQAGQMRHRYIVDRPVAYSIDYFLQSPRPQRVLPTTTALPQILTTSRSESLVASLRIFSSPFYTQHTIPLHSTTHPSHQQYL